MANDFPVLCSTTTRRLQGVFVHASYNYDNTQRIAAKVRMPAAGTELHEVCAVVVTWNPNVDDVLALVRRVAPQVGGIVIADNGSRPDVRVGLDAAIRGAAGARIIPLGGNLGVAVAQNAGIRVALKSGYRFVLLLDHDSLPAADMVPRLMAAFQELDKPEARVAAVGPRYVHRDTGGDSFFVQFGLLGFRRIRCAAATARVRTDFLISSGCLVSAEALSHIGLMKEELFVDQVDTEWFLRARDKKWAAYGICDATMDHALGELATRGRLGRWKRIPQHGATRNYYMFRNSIYLYGRRYPPLRWKLADACRLFRLLVLAVVSRDRRQRIRMMLAGVRDGVRGRLGPYDDSTSSRQHG
jgi:rhamnosyltransferase